MNILTFNEFYEFSKSISDSELICYNIENGVINLKISVEDDRVINISFISKQAIFNEISNLTIRNTGHLEIINISNFLTTEKGFYLPPIGLQELLKVKTKNIQIAIGNRVNTIDYIISYTGYENIISFTINSNDVIKVHEE